MPDIYALKTKCHYILQIKTFILACLAIELKNQLISMLQSAYEETGEHLE